MSGENGFSRRFWKRLVVLWVIMLSVMTLGAVQAAVDPSPPSMTTQPFTGTVTEIAPGLIEVRSGGNVVQFTGQKADQAAIRIKIGDRVTITTKDGAQSIQPAPKQQAGQKGHEIIDDRAFYNAGL